MKRLSFALLSVLLMFGLTSLVACGGGGGHEAGQAEEPAPAGPTEDDAAPAEEESAEPVSSAPTESDLGEGDTAHGDEEGGAVEVPTAAGDGGDGAEGDAGDDNQG